ncbi:adenosine deaminase [Legionella rubrilucens]|uniref:Adenosine deaminase n=1 Tax=Legionella rubrilucens TaxID=458 RepID=A0A0W0XRT3_9GAMM|nr:hypothetical protein [Legionella rubrilucens]KTD47198.1 adenosine deaminase [Legionella rubrilucens]
MQTKTEQNFADFHCHLNGSFSKGLLKKIAERNHCPQVYQQFLNVQQQYEDKSREEPRDTEACLQLIWAQFALVHKMVQKLKDIQEGTYDVIANSAGNYLEIRTTPKPMNGCTVDDYIDAFLKGLLDAREDTALGKEAYGLLSLDRVHHTAKDAEYFIQKVLKSDGLLKGIDISGQPLAPRQLTGQELVKTIQLALDNHVGLAIHMGEANTPEERQDTDSILATLEEWVKNHPEQSEHPFFGKIRLGHCIYLTEQQKHRIKALQLPIEVCPTCHAKLNWHEQGKPHPVASIYDSVSDPVVPGTDDETIFNADIQHESQLVFGFFKNPKPITLKEFLQQQNQYRF